VGKRRKGREIVLQSMYASLISGAPLINTVEDQLLRRDSADETADFARALAAKVKQNSGPLDRWMRTLVTANRDPSRLGTLEICILTMGLAELKHSPEVPFRVVINEACEMARRYCDEGAVGFVNGVLDRAAHEVYPPAERERIAAALEGQPDDPAEDVAEDADEVALDADFGDDESSLAGPGEREEDL
jgi:N utilization substance protein B